MHQSIFNTVLTNEKSLVNGHTIDFAAQVFSTQNIRAFTRPISDYFAPEAQNDCIFVSNLWFKHNHQQAAILESIRPDIYEKVLDSINRIIVSRIFLATNGNIVANESMRHELLAYSRHCEELKLVSEGSLDRIVFVNDVCDLDQTLQAISDQRPNANIVTYGARELFNRNAIKCGLSVVFNAETCTAAAYYGDKTVLKNTVESIFSKLSFPIQPRIGLLQNDQELSYNEIQGLQQLLDSARKYRTVDGVQQYDLPLLFIQESRSGGGFGNHKVYQNSNGTFIWGEGVNSQLISDEQALYVRLKELRQLSNVEIAPFFLIKSSYSIGVVCSNDELALFGTRMQRFHKSADGKEGDDYRGFQFEQDSRVFELRDKAFEVAAILGNLLKDNGYRGPFGIDFFIYVDQNNQACLGVAEINARFDGTSPLTQFLMRSGLFTSYSEKYVDRSIPISFMQDDYMSFHESCLAGQSGQTDTEKLVALLRSNGIPLVDLNPQMPIIEGVILMTPVCNYHSDSTEIKRFMIGVVASSDIIRNNIYMEVAKLLNLSDSQVITV